MHVLQFCSTFNFTQPYLSTLAIVALSALTVLLYFMPLRWIIMIWGKLCFLYKYKYVKHNYSASKEILKSFTTGSSTHLVVGELF